MCAATILLNRAARTYGDGVVAAISVSNKVFAVIFAVMVGYGQGFAPVVGYNYGAKAYDRSKKINYIYNDKSNSGGQFLQADLSGCLPRRLFLYLAKTALKKLVFYPCACMPVSPAAHAALSDNRYAVSGSRTDKESSCFIIRPAGNILSAPYFSAAAVFSGTGRSSYAGNCRHPCRRVFTPVFPMVSAYFEKRRK